MQEKQLSSGQGNHFFAMMHRMRYINRWGLMRSTEAENIQEHSLQVAMLAHALAVIRQKYFGLGRICPSPEQTALLGMFHDASEILTGDLPTPVKYFNPQIKEAYKTVEQVAAEKLITMLPDDLKQQYRQLLLPRADQPETSEAMKLVKAADKISAYIKCLDEEKAGNHEFTQARQSIETAISGIDLPEVDYFIREFLPSFRLTLDQISTVD